MMIADFISCLFEWSLKSVVGEVAFTLPVCSNSGVLNIFSKNSLFYNRRFIITILKYFFVMFTILEIIVSEIIVFETIVRR